MAPPSVPSMLPDQCPVEAVLDLIGGKWKGIILYQLGDHRLRFGELHRRMPEVTQRMLTKQLRELEAVGLVARHVYAEVPPRVEYELTPLAASLRPILLAIKAWGMTHLEPWTTRPELADVWTARAAQPS